jgi:hypothetical protein
MNFRIIAVAIGAAITIVLLATGLAGARGGSLGGGFGAGHGFTHFGARSFAHPMTARHPYDVFAHNHAARLVRFGRWRRPAVFADDLLDQTDDDLTGEPGWIPEPIVIYRPACRLHAQVRAVATEDGGEREVVITRCLSALDFASPWPQDAAPGRSAQTRTFEQAPEPSPTARPDRDACVRTVVVASEDGGERTVSVHRC